MQTFAQRVFDESKLGTVTELPGAGTSLENPYVYDDSARELMAMASQGLVRIVDARRRDHEPGGLICHLTFQRLL